MWGRPVLSCLWERGLKLLSAITHMSPVHAHDNVQTKDAEEHVPDVHVRV